MSMTRDEFYHDLIDMVADYTLSAPPGAPQLVINRSAASGTETFDWPKIAAVQAKVADYRQQHPDAVKTTRKRTTFSVLFGAFVVSLAEGISYGELSVASGVPVMTLVDWIVHHKPTQLRLRG